MGIHIYVYRIDRTTTPWKIDRNPKDIEWESSRHAHDYDFAGQPFLACSEDDPTVLGWEDDYYRRPEDFEFLRQWVKDNVVPNNQPRLLNIIDRMQQDPNLFFYFSC
jgi:hypothetical protein